MVCVAIICQSVANMEIDMTDYTIGLIVGGLVGYGFSMLTMIVIWSLCVIAKKADGGRYDGEFETDKDKETAKRVSHAD